MLKRQQEQLAELEVQKSSLESQLRISKWNQENSDSMNIKQSTDDEMSRQLLTVQRERIELKNKVDALNNKIRQLEMDSNKRIEKDYSHGGILDSNRIESLSTSYHTADLNEIERENRELRMKVRRLETQLAEKEAELARVKAKLLETPKYLPNDAERYRSAQIQAERILDAREQSHRQQVLRLENQVHYHIFEKIY